MSEHREWGFGTGASQDRVLEHNATVHAYRDAMAECSRVRKEALDTIHELQSRPVLTWEECMAKVVGIRGDGKLPEGHQYAIFRNWLQYRLPAPVDTIRVPFTDAQIEAMARAFYDSRWDLAKWDDDTDAYSRERNRAAIRAALAACGLEPCAVPEYKPEDVAFCYQGKELRKPGTYDLEYPHSVCVTQIEALKAKVENQRKQLHNLERREESRKFAALTIAVPERASDDELKALAIDAYNDGPDAGFGNAMLRAAAAVRARAEAPLLAEIAELRYRKEETDVMIERMEQDVAEFKKSNSCMIDEAKQNKSKLDAIKSEFDTQLILKLNVENLLRVTQSDLAAAQAEIQRLEIENRDRAFYVEQFAAVSQERDTLKARVAELNDGRDRQGDAIRELRAELEAANRRIAELEAGKAGWCETDRGNMLMEMSGLREQLEAAKAERDTFDSAALKALNERDGLRAELAALRQPVDPDAWKTQLEIRDRDDDAIELSQADKNSIHIQTYSRGGVCLIPKNAARVAAHLASYAAAHGCPVGLGVAIHPPLDVNKPKAQQGIYNKFNVSRTDGSDGPGGKHDGCQYFVLDRTHDKFAAPALTAYGLACATKYPELSRELLEAYPAPETRPVKVRWDVTAAQTANDNGIGTTNKLMQTVMDYLAAHAVIDVPAGVPSVPTLAKIGYDAGSLPDVDEPAATAIRNAVLDGVGEGNDHACTKCGCISGDLECYLCRSNCNPTPHEPTAAEVEALARAIDIYMQEHAGSGWAGMVRAAFNYFGRPMPIKCIFCDFKGKSLSDLKAHSAKCEKHPLWSAPIASAETLEQLAQFAIHKAAELGMDCTSNLTTHWQDLIAAILRAAKARVDVEPGQSYQHGAMTYSFEKHSNYLDWLNSCIVYGVQLPPYQCKTCTDAADIACSQEYDHQHSTCAVPTRAEAEAKYREVHSDRSLTNITDWHRLWDWLLPFLPTGRPDGMPSSNELAKIWWAAFQKSSDEKMPWPNVSADERDLRVWDTDAAEAILTALSPWLRTPTGWELDVTAEQFARWHQDTKHDQSANYEKFDDLGENYKEDFIVTAESSLNYLRSRIRPTFECKECATAKRAVQIERDGVNALTARIDAARAALEGGTNG